MHKNISQQNIARNPSNPRPQQPQLTTNGNSRGGSAKNSSAKINQTAAESNSG
jgi:hypothetical protein